MNLEQAKYDPIDLHVLHSHFSGLLFDFIGWLTTRKERLTLSSADNAVPAVEAIREFAKLRGLHLEDAQVETWQAILASPQQPAQQKYRAVNAVHEGQQCYVLDDKDTA
jgi:hypothetical protein